MVLVLVAASGSSPLVRGQRHRPGADRQRHRIIPARAGPTSGGLGEHHGDADHPRSCGANTLSLRPATSTGGSSPLVRGQPVVQESHAVQERIIPARAGPTWPQFLHWLTIVDHPRSCGANSVDDAVGHFMSGSSPLVRGQPPCRCRAVGRTRIIPARAGPTHLYGPIIGAIPDHPRSCGANEDEHGLLITAKGSSPLVRGQQPRTSALGRKRRIIPARAGPTIGCSKTRLS